MKGQIKKHTIILYNIFFLFGFFDEIYFLHIIILSLNFIYLNVSIIYI